MHHVWHNGIALGMLPNGKPYHARLPADIETFDDYHAASDFATEAMRHYNGGLVRVHQGDTVSVNVAGMPIICD